MQTFTIATIATSAALALAANPAMPANQHAKGGYGGAANNNGGGGGYGKAPYGGAPVAVAPVAQPTVVQNAGAAEPTVTVTESNGAASNAFSLGSALLAGGILLSYI